MGTDDLRQLRKSDWRKRLIGHLIKRRTNVPLRWYADYVIEDLNRTARQAEQASQIQKVSAPMDG